MSHVHGSGNQVIGYAIQQLVNRARRCKGTNAQSIQKIGQEADTNLRWEIQISVISAAGRRPGTDEVAPPNDDIGDREHSQRDE